MNWRSISKVSPRLKNTGEGTGIKALKEGAQIPGALKGTGSGTAPYGVPGGTKSGTGIAGGGTGTGSGGGSSSGLKGIPAADFNNYFNQLKRRVESVWKFPDGVSGLQKVGVVFTLDRSGKLIKADVLESSDPAAQRRRRGSDEKSIALPTHPGEFKRSRQRTAAHAVYRDRRHSRLVPLLARVVRGGSLN